MSGHRDEERDECRKAEKSGSDGAERAAPGRECGQSGTHSRTEGGTSGIPPERIDRIVDLFFEAGWLRHTPRSGWIFLGTGGEDVAQHSFRVALMSFVLAHLAGADPYRAAILGLFHDLHEARTSDLNYMNQRYASVDQAAAQRDAVAGTGLEDEIAGAFAEFEARASLESRLAKDADQLDLLFNLKVELDKGNAFADDWIEAAMGRLRTEEARLVARTMLTVDHNRWWFGRVDRRWWVDRRLPGPGEERRTRPAIHAHGRPGRRPGKKLLAAGRRGRPKG